MAIRFLMHDNDTNQAMYVKRCRIIDTLSQWIRSLSKQISIQRQRHGIKIINELPSTSDPFDFINNEVSIRIKNTIASLKRSYDNTCYKKIKLLTAFAAAVLVYENGQRSGVVTNLTINEVQNRQIADNGKIVVSCLHQKTGSQGRA